MRMFYLKQIVELFRYEIVVQRENFRLYIVVPPYTLGDIMQICNISGPECWPYGSMLNIVYKY